MLVVLGFRALRKFFSGWHLHVHPHEHDGHRHVHLHLHRPHEAPREHQHHDPLRLGLRPFLVGIVHGVAGSGALMLLVLGTMPSAASRVAYILMFGAGSIGGMLVMSALISVPFVFTAMRFQMLNRYIQAGAGMLSLGLGLLIAWQHSGMGALL
jgi:hypothetical protein